VTPRHIFLLSPFYDYFAGVPLGFFALIYSVLHFLIKSREEFLLRNGAVVRFCTFGAMWALKNAMSSILYYFVYGRFLWAENLASATVLTLLFYPVVYTVLLVLSRKYGQYA
jgi:cell shape-determining protein MreD